jgi:recombination protein RecA
MPLGRKHLRRSRDAPTGGIGHSKNWFNRITTLKGHFQTRFYPEGSQTSKDHYFQLDAFGWIWVPTVRADRHAATSTLEPNRLLDTLLTSPSGASTIGEQKANMSSSSALRAQIESRLPAAFVWYQRPQRETILTGISAIDRMTGGVPLQSLSEICGSNRGSSGKTSVLVSLLAQASQKYFCALVDAGDTFDPSTAEAAGVNLSRLCWVRCGKNHGKLRPLEQAFKAADLLLQNGGFGLIAVDLSQISEKYVSRVPAATWFRFSRVIEKQQGALVFLGQRPYATSCAALVLLMKSGTPDLSGNLWTQIRFQAELLRGRDKKPVQSDHPDFSLKTQWA